MESLFGQTRPLSRPTFRKWIDLEASKQSIAKATEGVEFPDRVLDYLSVAFGKTPKEGYWKDTVALFTDALQKTYIEINVPMIKNPPKEGKEPDWNYEGRTWNHLSHVLAKAYGWTLEYIASLDVVEAFGHIQEIFTDRHLEQEFAYSLSEIAYPYNKSTKKNEFKPMSRPYWMRPASKPVKKIKIKRSMLPVGYGVDSSGLGAELGGWNDLINETKKTDASRDSQTVPPPTP